jgi:tetratricopeptide (TPR) repeat protein
MAALAALKVDDATAAQRHAEQFLSTPSLTKHELVPKVLFILAESHLANDKDAVKADLHFRKLLADFPKHADAPKARLRLGFALYVQKKHGESIDILDTAAKSLTDPALLAEAYLLLGRNYTDMEKRTEAIAALRNALKVGAKWDRGDEVLLPLALNLRLQKDLNGAAAELQRLTSAFPKVRCVRRPSISSPRFSRNRRTSTRPSRPTRRLSPTIPRASSRRSPSMASAWYSSGGRSTRKPPRRFPRCSRVIPAARFAPWRNTSAGLPISVCRSTSRRSTI